MDISIQLPKIIFKTKRWAAVGGQVVSVFAFYYDNQSSNPADVYKLFEKS